MQAMSTYHLEKIISIFHLDKSDKKKSYGYLEGFLSIVVNVLLCIMKFIFGTILNSVALIADAVHSLSDVVTSLIVILGFRVSSKPADKEHPFGHGRAERVVSIVIACMLIAVGFEFFLNGFGRLQNPVPINANLVIIILLGLSIFIKELLYHFAMWLGKKVESPTLMADAWHHRTDAFSTILVLLGFVAFEFGFYRLDGILGMVVSVFITYTGVSIIKKSASSLIGEAPSPSFINRIKMLALSCRGVKDVHHIHVHDYGGKYEITIHIRLRADTHLDKAHKKATEVEECIKGEIKNAEVTVHVEPEWEITDD